MAMAPESGCDVEPRAAIRTFIAIELDASARRGVVAATRALREQLGGGRVRWARPETLHVTLRFLGDIEPSRVPSLAAALRAELCSVAPFELGIGDFGAFPSLRRPQVIYLEVGPPELLAALAGAVDRGVVRAGFPSESRSYRPHLTLGRVRRGNREPVTASVTAPAEVLVVDEITVFRSELARSGATHTPLERIALGGTVHP
jgi:2'-5' RNA ligase